MDAIAHELRSLIVERFDVSPDRIRPETDLIQDLGASSLDVIDLIMTIEERLGIRIEGAETERMRTFEDAVSIIHRSKRVEATQ